MIAVKLSHLQRSLLMLLYAGMVLASVPQLMPHDKDVTVMLGDPLRLSCPVKAEDVIYSWTVQDMPTYQIKHDPHYSFQEMQKVLLISTGVTRKDSGEYTCRGVTGFGSKTVKFNVRVIESQYCATPKMKNPNMKAPCFFNPDLGSESQTLQREVGSSVEFSCQASGIPPPKYLWFMGVTIADWIQTSEGVRGPVFKIRSLRREHTGRYTCKVSNEMGTLNYTYTLMVREASSATPRILSQLENQTAESGSETAFVAKVQCNCQNPIIQWLKRVAPTERDQLESNGKKVIPLPQARADERGEVFVALEKASISPLGEGVFVSRLALDKVDSGDSGKYVVMTMGRRGSMEEINYQVAYVNIVKGVKVRNNMIFYIAVPLVILIIVFTVTIYCYISRRRANYYRGRPLTSHYGNGNGNAGNGGLLNALTSSSTTTGLVGGGSSHNGCTKIPPGGMGSVGYSSSIQSPASQSLSLNHTSIGIPFPPPPPPGSVSTSGHLSSVYKYPPQSHQGPHYDQYTPLPQPLMVNNGQYPPQQQHLHMNYHSNSSNGYSMHQYPT